MILAESKEELQTVFQAVNTTVCRGNCDISQIQRRSTDSIFKLYILMYAEDTVILAKSKGELQAALNAMYLYCNL